MVVHQMLTLTLYCGKWVHLHGKHLRHFHFAFLFRMGRFLKKRKCFSLRKDTILERTVVQNGKQEATNVVSYCENGRKA